MSITLRTKVPESDLIAKLDLLEEAFRQKSIGRYVGSLAESGRFDLTYLTEDVNRTRDVIAEVINTLGLDAVYTTEVEEFEGDEDSFFEEVEPISVPKLMYFFGLVLFLLIAALVGLWNAVKLILNA